MGLGIKKKVASITLAVLLVVSTFALVGSFPMQKAEAQLALALGDIIVADPTSVRIIKVSPGGTQSLITSGIPRPHDVAFSSQGEIFVVDADSFGGQGGIFKIDSNGVSPFFTSPDFVDPSGIAIDNNNNIIIADSGAFNTGAIFKITPSGSLSVVAQGSLLVDPRRVAIDANGDYIVADLSAGGVPTPFGTSGAIIKITPSGQQSTIFEGGLIKRPHDLAVACNGDVYVADPVAGGSLPGGVIKITPSGSQSLLWSGGSSSNPLGLSIDENGNIIVVDEVRGAGSIIKVSPTGTPSVISSGGLLVDPIGGEVYPQDKCASDNDGDGISNQVEQLLTGGTADLQISTPGGTVSGSSVEGNMISLDFTFNGKEVTIEIPLGSTIPPDGKITIENNDGFGQGHVRTLGIKAAYPPGKSFTFPVTQDAKHVCIIDSPNGSEIYAQTISQGCSENPSQSVVKMDCSSSSVTRELNNFFPDEPFSRTYTCTIENIGSQQYFKVTGLAFSEVEALGEPILDTDGDGIPDDVDQCDFAPETFNGFQDADGCPDVLPSPPPAFSQTINSIFPNAQQSITCLQGHFDPSVPKHLWFYQSKVNGVATVEVRAAAVNPAEGGNLIAKLFDGATQIGSVTVTYPASGENTGSITIPSAVAGNIYRLEVELSSPASSTQAHHYKVTSSGTTFSVGVNSPTHRYSEHLGQPEVFQVNVGAGENFALNIFTESPFFGAPQATSVTVEIRDRSTLLTLLGPTTFPLGTAPASQLITLTNPFPSSLGQLVLLISADGHYRMNKVSGTDKAIYYDTCPPAPQLTVTKDVINDNGGLAAPADFNITVNGNNPLPANFPGSPTGTIVTLKAGQYSVTETGPNGYSPSFSDDCSGSIEAGDVKTCTITNDDIQPLLTITKIVVNDNGGSAVVTDFALSVNNAPVTSGIQTGFNAGIVTVSETGPSGYTATFSGNCDANGQVTLTIGDVKVCTITNNDIAPQLIVIKNVINDNGGSATASQFTITVTGNSPAPASFQGSSTGTTVTLNAGTYNVSETDPSGYSSTLSTDCIGSIGIGEVRTCTITNDDIQQAGGVATRTQGFWSTHFSLAQQTWLSINSADRIIGSKNMGDGPNNNDVSEMMGGFWSNISKKADGSTRTALDQARMQLVQQLLAAMLNKQAFGTNDNGAIAAGKTAFAGNDINAILSAKNALEAYNLSGDTQPLPTSVNAGSASPQTSRSNANKAFWNMLP